MKNLVRKAGCQFFTRSWVFILFCLTPWNTNGATITWDGENGNGEWTTAENWDGDVLPGTTDDVIIENGDGVTLPSGTVEVKSLKLDGSSSLNVSAAASLTVNSGSGSQSRSIDIRYGSSLTNVGTINLTGTETFGFIVSGTLTNGAGGTISSSTAYVRHVTVAHNGVVLNSGSMIFSNATLTAYYGDGGDFTNDGNGTFSVSGCKGFAFYDETYITINNYGAMSVADAGGTALSISNVTTVNNFAGGTITISGTHSQGIHNVGGTFNNEGVLTITGSTNEAFLNHNSVATFSNTGELTGNGTFDLNGDDLDGLIAPGTSPGTMTFEGDQTFTAGNTLEVEVNGTTPDTEHDVIEVNGAASIGGTLSHAINYSPTAGDRIVFLTATSVSGTFSSIEPSLPEDWSLDYSVSGEVALKYADRGIWTGDANDGDWNTPANWTTDQLPGPTDDVLIENGDGVTLSSGAVEVKSLKLDGSSSLNVSAAATLTVNGGSGSQSRSIDIRYGSSLTNMGTINLTGTEAFGFIVRGTLTNGPGGTIGSSTAYVRHVTVAHNGVVLNSGSMIFSNATQTAYYGDGGDFTNDGNGTFSVSSCKGFAFYDETYITINNYGAMSVADAGGTALSISNVTTVNNFAGGTITISGNHSQGIHNVGGTFNNEGTLSITGSTNEAFLNYNSVATFSNTGELTGNGTFDLNGDDLYGLVAPGASPGTMTFEGDQAFTVGNTMEIEVNGITPGAEHDVIEVNGAATIGGTLSHVINYSPTAGDRIVFLTATSVSGTFSSINPALPTDWQIDYYSVPGEVALVYQTVLPVELVSFSAREKNGEVALQWQTSSESNNKGFEIEHSNDGRNWNSLRFVAGHGNSANTHDYYFTHKNPTHGINYYRLRQMDFDGGFEYSEIRSVNFDLLNDQITVFPNPASNQTNIQLTGEYDQAFVKLMDINGQVVYEQDIAPGQAVHRLDLSECQNGSYFIQVQIDNWVSTQKLQIHKD